MASPDPAPGSAAGHSPRTWFLWGCLAPLLAASLACIGLALWFRGCPGRLTAPGFIRDAEAPVDEQVRRLRQRDPQDYDLDQTVTALYAIEKALHEAKGFEELTGLILREDARHVAPDAALLKYEFFHVYRQLLDARDDAKGKSSLFDLTTGTLLDITSMVGFDLSTGIGVDREQAQRLWQQRLAESSLRREHRERLRRHQGEMMALLFRQAEVSSRYIAEWNRLCAARDRAYLASERRDWPEAIQAAEAAIALAPREQEAHILLAQALLERGGDTDTATARTILDELLASQDGQPAPAYLLRGVIALREGRLDQAALDFDQAAAYYPRQQDEVRDRLNLYRRRPFLHRSKEGRVILNQYWGVMAGAGFFSPDFQQARLHLARGNHQAARDKVFDHFFRRRQQGEWDRVYQDFQFCQRYLQTDLSEVFTPADVHLAIEPAWLSNSVVVTVHNRSTLDFHNLTLLLCVRFTDMFHGDYLSFPVGDSVATLPAGKSITVGRRNLGELTTDRLGEKKRWRDIIAYGAVLISDERIAWLAPVPREPAKDAQEEEATPDTDKAPDTPDAAPDTPAGD
jgi:tetratricopeptide (TPR) repeat protein